MKKIESLTEVQKAKFPEYVDKWIRIGLNTEKANRPEAEKGIIEAYKIAGLKPPKIVWCDSPLSMGMTCAIFKKLMKDGKLKDISGEKVRASVWASVGDSVWASVRASVWDSVRASVRNSVWDSVWDSVGDSVGDSVWDSVRDSVGDSVWASVGASVRNSVGDSVWASVGDSVGDSVGASVWDSVWDSVGASVWDSVWDSVRDSVWDSVGDSVWDSVRDSVGDSVGDSVRASVRASVWASVGASVWDSGYGQHDANWIGYYDYFRTVLGLKEQTDKLQGLEKVTKNAGWFLPHQGICWISERTCIVMQDTNKRIHCETGPAIKYPDGWSLYYWHGVKIPGWIIETPQQITIEKIEAENNAEVRRVMITKYGMAKYLEQSGAKEIDRDRDTKGERILYSKQDKMGVIKMIKLENSTPELDGSKKYYTFRCDPKVETCQEAVAYLYSRDPKQYSPQVES